MKGSTIFISKLENDDTEILAYDGMSSIFLQLLKSFEMTDVTLVDIEDYFNLDEEDNYINDAVLLFKETNSLIVSSNRISENEKEQLKSLSSNEQEYIIKINNLKSDKTLLLMDNGFRMIDFGNLGNVISENDEEFNVFIYENNIGNFIMNVFSDNNIFKEE